jgi:hypothetical protein
MTRQDVLKALARRLEVATATGDWPALVRVDTDVAAALACMDGAWSVGEREALQALRAAHDAAFRGCTEEARLLGLRLEELERSKEGWMAYAMNDMPGQGAQ